MDLTNILNGRDGTKAEPSLQSHPHSPALSDHPTDHELSPRSSISPSGSSCSSPACIPRSASATLYPLSTLPNGAHLSGTFQHGSPLPSITFAPSIASRGPGRPSCGDPSMKAFPCTVCEKKFARRSDLARHGEHWERILSETETHVDGRAYTYGNSTSYLRLAWL